MRSLTRREWVARSIAAGASAFIAIAGRRASAQEAQVVKIVAQRFHYAPSEFRVKAGVPVVLEFTSLDFVHGFSMPDLGVRADLPPGAITRVQVAAAKPGTYDFLCDNFCGDEHESMHGRMIVQA